MKKLISISISMFLSFNCFSQSCLPEGINFYLQSQIDSFQINYPNCTQIEGDVYINGTEIHNLNGLSSLTSIRGGLHIGICNGCNTSLNNFMGLENLSTIGCNLWIGDINGGNSLLTSLTGLEGLDSIGWSLSISHNSALTSLAGLENLTSIGRDLLMSSNDTLTNLVGLEGLTTIGGNLVIKNNPALIALTGLGNIAPASISKLDIHDNISLASCEAECICDYLANPNGIVNIYNNANGCDNPPEVANNCGITMSCLPYGNYYFFSQDEIDDFPVNYPGCEVLEGLIQIKGADISNLAGLGAVTSIGGDLEIESCSALINMNGLENVSSIDGFLAILYNDTISDLSGLEGLTNVNGGLHILENKNLINLTGLDNVTFIGEYLEINSNSALTTLTGLGSLSAIGGPSDGDLLIYGNDALKSLVGLDNLQTIAGTFMLGAQLAGNHSLTSLIGLSNLTSIGGSLRISENIALAHLAGLDNLGSIGYQLEISFNDNLTSISGLLNLDSIGEDLFVFNNPDLQSLDGLDNINSSSISNLYVFDNNSLSACDVKCVCDYIADPNGILYISNNAPGCNSEQEVEVACGVSVDENSTVKSYLRIYPNPSSSIVTIEKTEPINKCSLTILDLNQRVVISRQILETITIVDISHLPDGVYFVRFSNENEVKMFKIVKY